MNITTVLLSILFVLFSCTQQNLDYPQRQMPTGLQQDQIAISSAADLFRRNCAYCHGHTGEGRGERADFFDPPAPDFYETKYRNIDPAYLFWRIAEGKTVEPFLSAGSVMPAWGPHFSDQEIWQMVAYLQTRAVGR